MSSEEEFAAFMTEQVPPAIEWLESAEANFAEAAEEAEGDEVAKAILRRCPRGSRVVPRSCG